MTLIGESRKEASDREISAFGTPTIVHFCAVLLISAILSAPWRGLSSAGLSLLVTGIAGVAYGLIVFRRTRRTIVYRPVFEDWLWFVILPLIGYAGLLISAILLRRSPHGVLFAIAGVALLLLFVGIHNAWDTVTYITIDKLQGPTPPGNHDS